MTLGKLLALSESLFPHLGDENNHICNIVIHLEWSRVLVQERGFLFLLTRHYLELCLALTCNQVVSPERGAKLPVATGLNA